MVSALVTSSNNKHSPENRSTFLWLKYVIFNRKMVNLPLAEICSLYPSSKRFTVAKILENFNLPLAEICSF